MLSCSPEGLSGLFLLGTVPICYCKSILPITSWFMRDFPLRFRHGEVGDESRALLRPEYIIDEILAGKPRGIEFIFHRRNLVAKAAVLQLPYYFVQIVAVMTA